MAQLLSLPGPGGLQLSAEITMAIENGPVVLEYKLVNRGRKPVDLLLEREDSRYRPHSRFVGPAPECYPPRFPTFGWFKSILGLTGPQSLQPGESVVRREYLHHYGILRPGRTYAIWLHWPVGLLSADDRVWTRLVVAKVEFTIQPDSAKVRKALYDRIATEFASPRLERKDYLHWSLVLAGCRHPMYRPLALASLGRQPIIDWYGDRFTVLSDDCRPGEATDALVAAIYNCSESPAEAARFALEALADGKTQSIDPFIEFWVRQEAVKRDLTKVGLQLLGTEPLDRFLGWREQTLKYVALRHLLMHLEPREFQALKAIRNPALRMLILLRLPDAFDQREAVEVRRHFAEALGPIEQSEFDKLVAGLRSSSFRTREGAESNLSRLGYGVRNQLAKSLRTEADAEARTRQERLISALANQQIPPLYFELVRAAREANKSAARPVLEALADSQMPETYRKNCWEALIALDR